VLAVPNVIAVAGASGQFVAIKVPDIGNEVCVNAACRYATPGRYTIKAGSTAKIWFSAWWPLPFDGHTPPPCREPIADVSRAEVPFASGRIQVEWTTILAEVCVSPVTMNISVEPT